MKKKKYNPKTALYKLYFRVTNSIAFLPSLISLVLSITSIVLIYLEVSGCFLDLKNDYPWLNIYSENNARVLVSTILAGLISLTVFSFSMVMSVLAQAYSNFTPKVIGGLINNQQNQITLGTYTGSIIYCFIVLFSFRKSDEFSVLPSFAIIFSGILAIICLILFVKFLNDISESIQIKNIIKNIYIKTKKKLEMESRYIRNPEELKSIADYKPLFNFYSNETGYLQGVDKERLIEFTAENDCILRMEIFLSEFIVEGMPLFSLNKIPEEHLHTKLLSFFQFYSEEKIEVNDLYGFRQLMEIAVKALSPGINDPGTAIICIDYLTSLLIMKINHKPESLVPDKTGVPRIIFKNFDFGYYLDTCLSPIITFGKTDPRILIILLNTLKKIAVFDKEKNIKELLNSCCLEITEAADNNLTISRHRVLINHTISDLNNSLNKYFYLRPIREDNNDY